MDTCKIVDFSEEWREKLRFFMRKTFPNYSNAYIEYCLDNSSGRVPSKIVVNSKDEVVGSHLYFCTKVKVNGEVIETQWGHDTYLEKEYRAAIGLEFMLMTQKYKGFGIGLTEINKKVQMKLKKVFFKGVFTYYLVSPKLIMSPFQKLFHKEPVLKVEEPIIIDGCVFSRVNNIDELTIPQDGFWFEGCRDIDFIRDKEFIKKRFLDNNVFQYYIYAHNSIDKSCYFVVRRANYRGVPALTISDFRYSGESDNTISLIIKAVRKLAIRSNIGIILFVCGDKNIEGYLKNRLHYKTKMDFISRLNLNENMSFCVTGADSDADFLK